MSEPMEDILRRAAADYHAPPETPREEMWARIRAELDVPAVPDAATGTPDAATRTEPDAAMRRRGDAAILPFRGAAAHRRLIWGVGLAAMLALGIGIGRMMPDRGPARMAEQPVPAGETEFASPQDSAAEPRGDVAPSTQLATMEAAPEAAAETASPRRRVAASPRPESSPRAETPRQLAAAEPTPAPREQGGQIYRFAAGSTLSQAEALLTAYRADVATGRLHPQIEAWARDVLSTTRLLLDSPAAEDPRLRTLFEDLELVLAQLVQLGGQPGAEELDLIEQTMEQRDMLPRLRSGIPAVAAAETD